MISAKSLRRRVIEVLKKQGFLRNPHVRTPGTSKRTLKRVQQISRMEQIRLHKDFLLDNFNKAKEYCPDGKDIKPANINLELREVQADSLEAKLFFWWSLIWWSIPYQRSYGRQMRFLIWDVGHDAPFGLILLQSPVLKMSVRDESLNIPKDELDLWVNRSMNAQRVGALPPYNELLGGKMVALSLTSNEVRQAYRRKYKSYTTILKQRKISSDLLFITTSSAFGKSSLYNRLSYQGEKIAECLGETQGSGTFHIPEELYQKLLVFLKSKRVNVGRGYGHGPSRKLKLISLALSYIGLSSYEFHSIKREFYLFPFAKNLRDVIQNGKRPIWYDRPFDKLVEFWKERWAIPRSERLSNWEEFTVKSFFEKTERQLKK